MMLTLFMLDSLSELFLFLLLLVGLPSLMYARVQFNATASKRTSCLLLQMGFLLGVLACLGIASTMNFFVLLWSYAPLLLAPLITAVRSKEADYSAWQAFFLLESGALLLLLCQLALPQGATWAEINILPMTSEIELALVLMIVACVIQSGLFPAHRWLMNSLSTPTPVSALMHAGFINASGLLLLRIAPLLARSYGASLFLLSMGALNIVIGMLMSAVQSEQKRALACSTVAQMGCLFVYVALGLHSLVAAHLITHAMYKAYSFLGMGFALQGSSSHILSSDNTHSTIKGAIGAFIAIIFAYGLVDYPPQSETVFAIFLAYLGYQIGGAPLPVPMVFFLCAASGFILMLWHQLFASILPTGRTPLGAEAIVIVLSAGIFVVSAPRLPMSWQRRLYSYALQASSPDSKALILSRQSAQGVY